MKWENTENGKYKSRKYKHYRWNCSCCIFRTTGSDIIEIKIKRIEFIKKINIEMYGNV